MSRTVYMNGDYLPEEQARVSIFDRGFLFADGVYEVSSVLHGKLVDNVAHLARLQRSMAELDLFSPIPVAEIPAVQNELIRRNQLDQGVVYLQVTRGAADRDFGYPKVPSPSLTMFTQAKRLLDNPLSQRGIRVISMPDRRWQRRDIKTIGLLASCMAKQSALNAGADDAWMVEDDHITEGSANNAYIVNHDGAIITRHLGNQILAGITRAAVLRLAAEQQIPIEERPFTLTEALNAAEAFCTSASSFVMPVVSIDGQTIGNGQPGAITRALYRVYLQMALADVAD